MKFHSLEYMRSAINQWIMKRDYYQELASSTVTVKRNGKFVTDQYGVTHDLIKIKRTANYCVEQLEWWQERLKEAQALEVLPSSFKLAHPLDIEDSSCPTSTHGSKKLTVSPLPIKNIKR
jgi:hypothetical protein